MADDFAKLALGHQQSRADPTLDVIAVAPAFDVSANGFDDGKGRLDYVRAAQGTAKLVQHAQLVNGQRFFHAFFQAARRAGIQIHQLAVQLFQGAFGVGVLGRRIRVLHFSAYVGFVFVRQMIDDVAFLVNLTTLQEGRFARVLAHGGSERYTAIQNVQSWRGEVQSTLYQLAQQRAHDRRVFRRALANAQYGFRSIAANPKGCDHLPVFEGSTVDQHRAQP